MEEEDAPSRSGQEDDGLYSPEEVEGLREKAQEDQDLRAMWAQVCSLPCSLFPCFCLLVFFTLPASFHHLLVFSPISFPYPLTCNASLIFFWMHTSLESLLEILSVLIREATVARWKESLACITQIDQMLLARDLGVFSFFKIFSRGVNCSPIFLRTGQGIPGQPGGYLAWDV